MVTLMGSVDTGHEDMVHDAQLDFYGTRLATCSSDRTIRIFELADNNSKRRMLDELKGHKGPVWQICWSHPIFDSLLASASQDGTMRIWQEISGGSSWVQCYEYKDHQASVNAVCFAPYQLGLMVATASADGSIAIITRISFNDNPEWQTQKIPSAHEMGVNAICWAPAPSRRIVSGGSDGLVKLWYWHDDSGTWCLDSVLAAHKDCVRDVSWCPCTSQSRIASCGQDMCVVVWHEETNQLNENAPVVPSRWIERERIKLDHVIWTVSWCMTGSTLAIAGQDNRVRLFKERPSGQFVEITPTLDQSARNASPGNVTITNELAIGRSGAQV